MLYRFIFLISATIIITASCKKDTVIVPDTSTTVTGNFNFVSQRSGTLVHQNGSPMTKGTVQLGTDDTNTQFLKTSTDFATELSGAVDFYMSKGNVYNKTTVQVVSAISKNGQQYFKITPNVGTDFTHAIIWCHAANVAFGYVELK